MELSPDPKPRKSLTRPIVMAIVVIAAAGLLLGVGDVVRAAFQDPPLVKPYDPLPNW